MKEQKFEYVNYALIRKEDGNNVKWSVMNPMNDITPIIGINFQEGSNLKQRLWFTIEQDSFSSYPQSPIWEERKNALEEALEAVTYFKEVINENRVVSLSD